MEPQDAGDTDLLRQAAVQAARRIEDLRHAAAGLRPGPALEPEAAAEGVRAARRAAEALEQTLAALSRPAPSNPAPAPPQEK